MNQNNNLHDIEFKDAMSNSGSKGIATGTTAADGSVVVGNPVGGGIGDGGDAFGDGNDFGNDFQSGGGEPDNMQVLEMRNRTSTYRICAQNE